MAAVEEGSKGPRDTYLGDVETKWLGRGDVGDHVVRSDNSSEK